MKQTLLTVKETQKALNCGRTTIYKLIASGDLKRIKLGGATRITVASVKQLVEAAT